MTLRPIIGPLTTDHGIGDPAWYRCGTDGYGEALTDRTLVLNATYEPLSIVSTRRAVVLVLRAKADTLAVTDTFWHSADHTFAVPSVVRLRDYVMVPYHRRVPLTRTAVFARDSHRCQYCRAPAESLDHVVPKAHGGPHTWENVVACCRRCNIRKGNRLPHQAGLKLTRTPATPTYQGWLYAALGKSRDPRWVPYLLAEPA